MQIKECGSVAIMKVFWDMTPCRLVVTGVFWVSEKVQIFTNLHGIISQKK
jgi:hypothetical protein